MALAHHAGLWTGLCRPQCTCGLRIRPHSVSVQNVTYSYSRQKREVYLYKPQSHSLFESLFQKVTGNYPELLKPVEVVGTGEARQCK